MQSQASQMSKDTSVSSSGKTMPEANGKVHNYLRSSKETVEKKKKTDKNGGCNNEYAKNNNISHSFIFMNIKLPIKVYLYKI